MKSEPAQSSQDTHAKACYLDFEFGQTARAKAFFARNPKFIAEFERLMAVANLCFGREIKPKNRVEDICFWLGHKCREDFMEVAFVAVESYGSAASKILRGLYERAVTLAYLVKNPAKAERFVRFAAIQEHRALEAALKVVTEQQFDDAIGRTTTAAQIRRYYEQVKPEFQAVLCKKCGSTRTQSTWDLDVAAMVHKVGDPYDKLYLGAYTIPNFHVHATLASALRGQENTPESECTEKDAEFALITAIFTLILVFRSQNQLFSLCLDTQIEACEKELAAVWTTKLPD